jgi:predicted TPR repeat methyltransferase
MRAPLPKAPLRENMRRLYEKLVEENPANSGYWRRLADSRYFAGEYAASIPAYEKMLELRADRPSYRAYALARAYAQGGDAASGMR